MANFDRSFFIKAAGIVAILVALDQGFGTTLQWLFQRSETPEYSPISYALNKTNADIIVFGNSRAVHHYNSSQITDSIGLSSYNAGKDGHYIFYHAALLRSILDRTKPKVIILEVSPWEFEKSSADDIYPLRPYYHTNNAARATINDAGPWERYKAMSKLYCFNSLPASIVTYTVMKNNQRDETNGFVPLQGDWKKPIATDPKKYQPASQRSIKGFDNFLKVADQAGCKVIVCVSPRYHSDPEKPFGIALAQGICLSRSILFCNFSIDRYWLGHPEFFRDTEHLNVVGAQEFTRRIVDILKTSGAVGETHAF